LNSTYRRYLEVYRNAVRRNPNNMFLKSQKGKRAIATDLIREEVGNLVDMEYTISSVRSRIEGSDYEYDLLVVRKDAVPSFGKTYRPEDVAAVIECKANGMDDPEKDSSSIAIAANAAHELNPEIRFGYITMNGKVPEQTGTNSARSTMGLWELTRTYLKRKLNMSSVIYAVTLAQGKDMLDDGSDAEFHAFVNALTPANG